MERVDRCALDGLRTQWQGRELCYGWPFASLGTCVVIRFRTNSRIRFDAACAPVLGNNNKMNAATRNDFDHRTASNNKTTSPRQYVDTSLGLTRNSAPALAEICLQLFLAANTTMFRTQNRLRTAIVEE